MSVPRDPEPERPAEPSEPAHSARPAEVGDEQATFAATLVDEWLRAGLTDAVVCPGSRSTPLALALADRAAGPELPGGGLTIHVHHDERSGGFLALGLGLATDRPALVLTTSGTAAAELHPAVVEADLAGVPLLVCTADRPPELRDVGAPQAIDQVRLFGGSVRWDGDPGVPDATGAGRWRAFAARAYAEAVGTAPGPVHLNLPFREPLVGTAGPLPPARADGPWVSIVDGRSSSAPADAAALARELAGHRRGVIVAGAADVDGVAVHEVALALGWPVVAEPQSPAWIPALPLVDHVDAVLRASRAVESLRPEVVVRFGAPGSSRVVNEWLAASGAREVVAGAVSWSDPAATAAAVVDGDAGAFLAALAHAAAELGPDQVGPDGVAGQDGWFARWRAASAAARRAVATQLDETGTGEGARGAPTSHTEPGIARAVVRGLPDGAHLVVSSSMPIRDVERYAVPRSGVRVLANRGANGIDGVVSTAVGVALAAAGPTGLLVGDVAFLHDSNGLLGAAGRGVDLACVVVDNDGGGIFSFLPQARLLESERFETLFGTPHGLDLVALAAAYGVDARRVDPGDDVAAAVAEAADKGGVRVLVVTTDRVANVAAHRAVDDAVAAAVDAALSA
jgi:2-succinyl-5-enolpyruvyl-6-hydroxy-3-cyclohexene-1-carboxylate synthase